MKEEAISVNISVSKMDRYATIERSLITAISAARKLGDYDLAQDLLTIKRMASDRFDAWK